MCIHTYVHAMTMKRDIMNGKDREAEITGGLVGGKGREEYYNYIIISKIKYLKIYKQIFIKDLP